MDIDWTTVGGAIGAGCVGVGGAIGGIIVAVKRRSNGKSDDVSVAMTGEAETRLRTVEVTVATLSAQRASDSARLARVEKTVSKTNEVVAGISTGVEDTKDLLGKLIISQLKGGAL